jgi:signal transduction histidine kinase/DNA-binding response OmpR family regulator
VPAAISLTHSALSSQAIADMLDQSRVAISEVARGQLYRNTVLKNAQANQLGLMFSRFFAARSENEIFDVLAQGLPSVGIRPALVAYYQAEGDDPVAWSVLQPPGSLPAEIARFPSREFPPRGIFPTDKPFSLALLPLSAGDYRLGYMVFDTSSMEYNAQIVRQLLAAIQGVRLYQEAVDARKQAEEQRQIAEEANHSKSRFLSMVSHEVRTPLNLISGLSDMLLKQSEKVGPGEYRIHQEDLDRIYVTSRHLDELIQDVIELSSLDVGHLKLSMDRLDLREVLDSVAVIGKQLAHTKGLGWSAEIAGDLPRVLGDQTRLRQVILNLVNNAVKFTTNGRVTLTAFAENSRITVAVNDTGLGIPVEEQDAIFDEFRQSTRTSARGFGGLGLGLAISRRLVELHGGKLGVCSSGAENQGSMFFFSLPVIDEPVNLAPIDSPSGDLQRVMILVKETPGSNLLQDYLERQGFEVSVQAAGDGADWLCDLPDCQPDAVVLDGALTAERGWDILRQLKEKSSMANVPVLFYTLNEADQSGAFLEVDYMVKPIEAANLAEILISMDLQNDLNDEEWTGDDKTILIADDDPGIRNLHSRIVAAQSQHNRVLEAHDGREALNLIRSAHPDLVLLDLMMPEMDGFAVLEAMREDEASRNIPVVVVTGQRLTEEDMARLNAGVASVLAKGIFTPDETLQALSATLQRKRRPGTETQRLVLKAMAYIHTHYNQVLSRGDVASHVGVSERHLSRCFQQEVGLTPMTYLNRFRVKVARGLLDAGDLSITDVALEVGFSTGGYFTRVFRDEMGVSPRAYLQSKC